MGLGSPRTEIKELAVCALRCDGVPMKPPTHRLQWCLLRAIRAAPPRAYDHRIHLLLGTAPVALGPYWYLQPQKNELEAQCNTMLHQGIIRQSTSTSPRPSCLSRSMMAPGDSASTTRPSTDAP